MERPITAFGEVNDVLGRLLMCMFAYEMCM